MFPEEPKTSPPLKKRPLAVTTLSLLIAAAGAIGFAYHLTEFNLRHPFQNDVVWVSVIRLIAIVCGVYTFRGRNWARWLAMAWIGFHVVVSAFHSSMEFAVHGMLFLVFAYFLFRPQAREYFRTVE